MNLANYLAIGAIPTPDDVLVMGASTCEDILALQAVYGDSRYQMQPVLLVDGRWGIGADVLTEVDGVFSSTFQHIPRGFSQEVEVISRAEFQSLLSKPEPLTLRSRNEFGQYIPDDLSTPDVNEAWTTVPSV